MKFSMNNFRVIKDAKINIEDITIIAGNNNTGKSSISKSLYSIIRAATTEKTEHNSAKVRIFINSFIRFLRVDKKSIFFENARDIYEKEIILNQNLMRILSKISFIDEKHLNTISKIVLEDLSLSEENILEVNQILKVCQKAFNENNFEDFKKIKFRRLLLDTFNGSSKPKLFKYEGETNLKVNDSVVYNEDINEYNSIESYLEDIIYISSPIDWKPDRAITSFKINSTIGKTTAPDLELLEKTLEKNNACSDILKDEIDEKNNVFLKEINKIIKGDFFISDGNVKFLTDKEKELDLEDLGTGIRSFAIITLLLKNYRLYENTMLIIDEPEAHLHTEWQYNFAIILTELSKRYGVKILINSHSALLINTVVAYSEKIKFDNINLYLTKRNDDDSVNVEEIEDPNYIYNELGAPFMKLDDLEEELIEGSEDED